MECGVESVECGVWSVKCGVWSVECGVRSVKCGVWSVKCRVWSVKCGVVTRATPQENQRLETRQCGVQSVKNEHFVRDFLQF